MIQGILPRQSACLSYRPLLAYTTVEELLCQAAQGDQAAFRALYDQLADPVFGLIKRVLRDPALAEEVAQEVFLEVWRLAPRFDPDRGSARAWVMTMAHRRAVDRVRSEQSAQLRNQRVQDALLQAPADSVGDAVEARLLRQEVRNALEGLTDLQRESIQLAYYGGLTYVEVAEQLNLPLATVKTRMRDGLLRLRRNLKGEPA